ncbi:T9SS type A sorting domain-containing protein [uncultured Pontibacter sp.]|uniref:T9SS type A sorting domain-containing protein n=1 Tax=uncultured Pontibacter sp. TaxID=453356 RepID=UPI00262A2F4F|nr:T9SS type A sorting domain-containing protein [uncultured Pontibacter sp.]
MYPDDATVTLQGNSRGDVTPMWVASNGGNIVSGANTLTPVVDAAGTYTLTLTHISGCTMQDEAVVTREENTFTARIFSSPIRFTCPGPNHATLDGYAIFNEEYVSEGITYQWSGPNGFSSNNRRVGVTEPGEYTLVVTDTNRNLTASASLVINPPMQPTGSAGPDKVLTSQNSTVTLEGSGSESAVIWFASDGGNIVSGERSFNPVVDAPGTYTMRVTNVRTSCTFEDTVKVTREEELTVSATGGKLDCATASVQLMGSSSAEGAIYSWTGPNGYTSTEQNPIVKVAGDYTLTVTDPASGSTASTSVVVTPVSTEMEVTNHTIDFDSEKRGLITSIETEAGPVALMGRKRNGDGSYSPENYAAIFDTQDPTGDDTNLYTTNWGNALIINEYHNDLPDATRWGGELILDFSAIGPVTMESMNVVGMDVYEQMSWVYLYDADGKELNKVYLKPLGMNSKQTVNLGNTRGVMMMKVVLDGRNSMDEFSGSAAIDDIKFHVETTVENPCEVAASNITHSKAYPTSFSDQATLEFIVRETENYSINLYDTQGMLVKQLRSGIAKAGELTTVELNGRELKEGMYFARLVSDSGSQTFKLILKR